MINLTDAQLKMLAGIFADAGQVFLASAVVPFLIGSGKISLSVWLAGVGLTCATWFISLVRLRETRGFLNLG